MAAKEEMMKATSNNVSVLAQYPAEQIDLLRNQIAPGFNDRELAYCLTVARARNLDPFQKQVYFTKRKQRLGDAWIEKVDVEPTIGGLQAIADRTGELDGEEEPQWCGPDGEWQDVWLDEHNPPVAARFRVYRKGRSKPFHAVAKYSEYVQLTRDGRPTAMWQKMPANQLMKCAEAKALRRAFPTELGGIYTHEEMGQADNPGRFDSLPPERQHEKPEAPPSNVVAIEGRPPSRQSEALPEVPKEIGAIPASILLAIKPLHGLEGIPIREMDDEDLGLVVDAVTKFRDQRKANNKISQRGLDWLAAISGAAAVELAKRKLGVVPVDDNAPPPPDDL